MCTRMKTPTSMILIALLAACSPAADEGGAGEGGGDPAQSGRARAGVASADLVLTKAPADGAKVTSPVTIEGSAPNDWYSAGQFVTQLVNAEGVVIAQSPALPQSDWQKPGAVPFIADLVFEVDADTRATIVLQEDTPRAGQRPREKRIAVVLAGR
jgi:Immunoglobulin-like domain of bacterial spore germination